MKKCRVRSLNIEMCAHLQAVCESSHSRKGIVFYQYFNIETRKPSRSLVVAKGGEHLKKGLALNYCPFCGVDIVSHMTVKPK